MDLHSQLAVVAARRWLILMAIAVATAVSLAVSLIMPKVYEAQTTLLIGQSLSAANPDYNQLLVSENLTATYMQLATSQPVLERAASTLGLSTAPDQLAKQVATDQPQGTSLITITAQASTASGAAGLANAVANALIAQSPTHHGADSQADQFVAQDLAATQQQIQSIQADVTRLLGLPVRTVVEDQQLQHEQDQLVSLRSSYASLLAASNAAPANIISVVGPAAAPSGPASPRPLLNVALGAGLGLLIALALAFLLDYLDDSVRTVREVRTLTGVPTLGTVSRIPGRSRGGAVHGLAAALAPRSPAAEAFRSVRTNLSSIADQRPLHVVLVTSAAAGEGKTVVAANLAIAFAQIGRSTVLVDADLREPDVHRLFRVPDGPGLSELLRGPEVRLEQVLVPIEPNLFVVRAGAPPTNPAELLASPRMRVLVQQLRDAADMVIVDSPPLRGVTDAAVLAGLVDGVILVVSRGRTSRSEVRAACRALAAVGARILGAIVNRVPERDAYRDSSTEPQMPLRGDETFGEHPAPLAGADGR